MGSYDYQITCIVDECKKVNGLLLHICAARTMKLDGERKAERREGGREN